MEAAKVAAERGVRVYPIGFGTRTPTSMVCTAAQLGSRGSEYGGGPRRWRCRRPELPRRGRGHVAAGRRRDRREYFAAADADRLQRVLEDLPRTVQTQHREIELSVWLAGSRLCCCRERGGGGALDGVPDLSGSTDSAVVMRSI